MPQFTRPTLVKRLAVVLTAIGLMAVALFTAAQTQAGPPPPVQDPHFPRFQQGQQVDKANYLRMREDYFSLIHGAAGLGGSPFQAAIAQMQAQLQQQRAGQLPQLNTSSWTAIGPAPITNGFTYLVENSVSGRALAIDVDPLDRNVVFVGTAQGGLYRSLNGGVTWTALLDAASGLTLSGSPVGGMLAVNAVTIDPNDSTRVWVGTGEADYCGDCFAGVGVYRISNAKSGSPTVEGPFYTDTGSGANDIAGRGISRIMVTPGNSAQIYVGTGSGTSSRISGGVIAGAPIRSLYRSQNALAATVTFSRTQVAISTDERISDLIFAPNSPNNLIVALYDLVAGTAGGVYTSTTASAVTPVFSRTLPMPYGTNIKLAVGPFPPQNKAAPVSFVVYAYTGNTGFSSGNDGTLYRSFDGGTTWPSNTVVNACEGQCFYDMPVAADPNNGNVVFVGGNYPYSGGIGNSVMKSTNGGVSFIGSQVGLHPDNHFIKVAPSDSSTVYDANDGGIFKSTDGGADWSSLNNSQFFATQFVGLAVHPTDPNFTIGGTQDNGTNLYSGSLAWFMADGGDGGYSLIDQNATDTTNVTMYHTYYNSANNLIGFARVTKTACANPTDGWVFRGFGFTDSTTGCEGVPFAQPNGLIGSDPVLFYAPMALGPGNPNTLYFGTNKLYRSTNKGDTMVIVSQAFATTISEISISPQDDNFRMVGIGTSISNSNNGQVWRDSTGSGTFINVTGGWPTGTSKAVTALRIDPDNKNNAFVGLGSYFGTAVSHVWHTTNAGALAPTWVASTGIPDIPVNAIAVDPSNDSYVYVGTDIGVYSSSDGGATFVPMMTGMPQVAVFRLEVQDKFHILRAATHGKGMYEISLSAIPTAVTLTDFAAGASGQTLPLALAGGALTLVLGSLALVLARRGKKK